MHGASEDPALCIGGDGSGKVLRTTGKSSFQGAGKVSFRLRTLGKSPQHQLRAHRCLLRADAAEAFQKYRVYGLFEYLNYYFI